MNNFNEFLKAIKRDDFDNTMYMLKDHSDYLSNHDDFGLKPIHWVCLLNKTEILKHLLKKKCDIETRSKNGWRAIHFAALMGHMEVIKCLIENYCEIDCKTDNNETPLDVSDGKSNYEFIDEIFDKTINLKIGLKMGLSCGTKCEHRFCLITMLHEIEMGKKIGEGTFGKIYQIGDILNEKTFACKNMEKMKNHKLFKKRFKNNIIPDINEYLCDSVINHAKIVTYYGSIEIRDGILLVMEHMRGGSIEDMISSNGLLPEIKILQYTKDILQGLAFLHKNNIIHRRVKPSHMLINVRDECKLSISTFSRLLVYEDIEEEFNLKDILPGTLNFMAPEIINGLNYNLPVDIWSLGCSLINMLTGFPPYYQFQEYQLCFLIGTIKKIDYKARLSISGELKSIIVQMLSAEIQQRVTVKCLLMNSLFQNVSNNHNIDHSNNTVFDGIFDFNTDRDLCSNLIKNTIDNKKIGKLMGFKCEKDCDHKLCLSSVTATNFKKFEKIGEGGCGLVYKARESSSDRIFAIKRLKQDENDDKRYFENRINKYKHLLNNDSIIKYYGAVQNIKHFYIFMEYMEGGSLTKEIKANNGFLPEKTIKKYSKQILEGVQYLHSCEICHRDIKSDNILINNIGDIKIADFGFSRILSYESFFMKKSRLGTTCYMSPEMIKGENYDFKTDIWSVGATVLEMSSGLTPYSNTNKKALFKNEFTSIKEYPQNVSKEIKRFLDLMLQYDPKKRATATELLKSDFFNTSFQKKKSYKRFFCVFRK